jgi:hypothetical protein
MDDWQAQPTHAANGSPWTEEDEQKLIDAVSKGMPKSHIYQQVPTRTPASINYKLTDLKKKGLIPPAGAMAKNTASAQNPSSSSTASATNSPAGNQALLPSSF